MICTHCHTPNPSNSDRCAACGSALDLLDGGVTLEVPDTVSLPTGADFGPRYHVEMLLGAGGMGKVYKARDKELDRIVAIKVLRPELMADPSALQRFKHELLLASKISHPNILRIHDLGEYKGTKFISMAFVEGGDLTRALRKEGRFTHQRAIRIMRQLCEALSAAHAVNVVHRDLKPQNILLGENDHVYVSDFGLAKTLEADLTAMTRTGVVLGTPLYMSPEHVEGKAIDHRSDLYSLGLIFYEMLTGVLPFSGDSTLQLMYQRVHSLPRRPDFVVPGLPSYLSRICLRCLEREPEARYQNAQEILADLNSERSPSLSVARTVQINLPVIERRWWYAGGAGILLLTGLFFAIPKTRHWVFAPPNAAGAPSQTVRGLPAISQGKFVAVLPFRVLGDQASLGYIAEGLNEAMAAKLFQLKNIRLTSPAAVAKADPKAGLPHVAKDLGVNLIVHGTVQGSPDNLRITVNLENMSENRLIWSEEFAGLSGDLLTIEDKIYARLVEALETRPSTEEMAAASAHPTENAEAYDLYLKGRKALSGAPSVQSIEAGMDYFRGALKKDPGFALAYTGLADANLGMYEQRKDKYWSEQAVDAARRAVQLNDRLPEAHYALGSAYADTGQNVQAIVEQKRALELAPNSDEAHRRLGSAYQANGQKEEALRELEKAVEINPYYWNNLAVLAGAYLAFGEPEKAVKLELQVIDLEPDNPSGYSNLGVVYFNMGRYEESITAFQKSILIRPSGDTYTNLGTSLFYLKRYSEALPMFQKAVEMSPEDQVNMGNLADCYRWAGDNIAAQATYEKAINLAYKELRVNPRDATVLGSLALYYAKKGDLQKARDFINKARAIDRSNVYLIYIAAIVDTIDNQPAGAVKQLSVALEKGFSPKDVAVEPEFGPLESRDDFQAMMKRFDSKKR